MKKKEKINNTFSATFSGDETLLIADDEDRIRDLMKKVLEAHGYKVLTASDGKEAVKIFKAKKGEIALVILDILMPKMNGEEACSEIKKIDPFAKVLISTGYIDSESAKAAIQQCDNKYVEKPFHIQELLYAIRANINLQKKK